MCVRGAHADDGLVLCHDEGAALAARLDAQPALGVARGLRELEPLRADHQHRIAVLALVEKVVHGLRI